MQHERESEGGTTSPPPNDSLSLANLLQFLRTINYWLFHVSCLQYIPISCVSPNALAPVGRSVLDRRPLSGPPTTISLYTAPHTHNTHTLHHCKLYNAPYDRQLFPEDQTLQSYKEEWHHHMAWHCPSSFRTTPYQYSSPGQKFQPHMLQRDHHQQRQPYTSYRVVRWRMKRRPCGRLRH